VFLRRSERPTARRSVYQDWLMALPREKDYVFGTAVRQWECSYAMMSVALDDALTFRARGELVCARQQVSVAADLLGRLSGALLGFYDAVSRRGRRITNVPAVEPMKTEFFRGDTAQSAASWNGILHHVVFGERWRFFQKLRILSETLEQLDREFGEAARDIAEGVAVEPGDCWKMLDCLHYDFNSCLRETEVVLKSFLRALPAEQLPAFAAELEAPVTPKRLRRMRPALSRASA
jgi:hypothetical protein